MKSSASRYLVGIDLGTTHTAVAFADISSGVRASEPQLFEIEQLVAAGEIGRKPLLPSFRYHPIAGELATEDIQLPWGNPELPGELDNVVIGEWARELSSKVEGRAVTSAKSWLSHSQIDRSADILPWAGAENVAKVSPILASASYLNHVRQAWNYSHPNDLLEDQEVVITVPASFDEVARTLTVEAARQAKLEHILLLEEPQAVCYAWYARNHQQAEELLANIKLLLVCDIGGGTTDLSLIQVTEANGSLALNRIGVGDHLMLGGDNQDWALAHLAEQRIVKDGKKLSAASLSQLLQQTRIVKERLLAEDAPENARVTLLGSGSRLIGGARSCELTRTEAHNIALNGFWPVVDLDDKPTKRRSAIMEFGLPFVSDPAISKHLAVFLAQHRSACHLALTGKSTSENIHTPTQSPTNRVPDAVLFNGGVFNSPLFTQRAQDQLSYWRDGPIKVLENQLPDLAVAFGAVAYAMARHGSYLKIGGGSSRNYLLLLDNKDPKSTIKTGVCILPKGYEEGQELVLKKRDFSLAVGKPASFSIASCSSDHRYEPGELVSLPDELVQSFPPLITALDGDDKLSNTTSTQHIDVTLATRLTEVGTLDIECVAKIDDSKRWKLEFEVRKNKSHQKLSDGVVTTPSLPIKFNDAKSLIEQVFGLSKQEFDPKAVKRLRSDLEKLLGKREDWDSALLRALFDVLLQGQKRRRRSAVHERSWFNLAGFVLRPGFGNDLDSWRIDQIWPMYQQGIQFDKDIQTWIDWWTFWRRVAGGLNAEQQQRIYKDIGKYINPASSRNRKLQTELKNKSYDDMVRLVGSLEQLEVNTKKEIGRWLLKRLAKSSETQTSWWALGRLGCRTPFHGSAHNVIELTTATDWLEVLLERDWNKHQQIAFSAVMLSRMSGDRSRDISDSLREKVLNKLVSAKAPSLWIEMVASVKTLDENESKRVYGEALPSGLRLIG